MRSLDSTNAGSPEKYLRTEQQLPSKRKNDTALKKKSQNRADLKLLDPDGHKPRVLSPTVNRLQLNLVEISAADAEMRLSTERQMASNHVRNYTSTDSKSAHGHYPLVMHSYASSKSAQKTPNDSRQTFSLKVVSSQQPVPKLST